MNWKTVIAVVLLAFSCGCSSKKNFVILSPSEDGSVGALTIETTAGKAVLDQPGMAVYVADKESKPSEPIPVDMQTTETVFANALAVHPLMPKSFLLYFKFNSNELTEESMKLLPTIKEAAEEREVVDIAIIGHTDRTGEDEYNRQLSLERAQAVFKLMKDGGVDEKDMAIAYHGEGNPLIPTADNVAEPRNRRVEVVVR